jgi:hypothetical protein
VYLVTLLPADLVFFRFMTLTTVGYGDIISISAEARLVAVFESVAGVFLLAFLVARLVALSRRGGGLSASRQDTGRHTSGPEHPPGATSVCV